jgi:membrane-associated phospholipid phosphatase
MVHLLVLVTGVILILSIPKLELHLLVNSSHTPFQDRFFSTITLLGDGWFAVMFAILFLFLRTRYFFMLIVSFSISGLLAQFFKHAIFPDVQRPAAFLDEMQGLTLVPGTDLFSLFSFPSGHTTTAFAVLLLAGFISGRNWVFFTTVVLAWLVGFSRVYLSQHFLADILAGSVLGTLSALFFYWYFRRLKPVWFDRSLIAIIRGKKDDSTRQQTD